MIKKYHGGLKLLLPLLFFMVFVTCSNNCKAYTIVNSSLQLSSGEMTEIIDTINLSNYFSGEMINTVTQTFNRWSRLYNQTSTYSKNNILFFKQYNYSNSLAWTLSNATVGDLPYLYLGNSNNYALRDTTTYAQISFNSFNGWLTNSSGEITGASTGAIPSWYIQLSSPSSYSQMNTTNTGISMYSSGTTNTGFTISLTPGGNSYMITIPNLVALTQTYIVYSYTANYGRDTYFLGNYLILTDETSSTTPTPTPTTTGEGGGSGGSTDLTQTNQKIDDVKNEIQTQGQAIVEKIPSSGEIIQSTIKANNEYWGNSGELSGEKQENEIENVINRNN